MTNKVKKRQRKPKSEFQKQLDVIRKFSPSHVLEVELHVWEFQHWKMERIGEQLRIIRNTVLGELLKNYKQMVRTKAYKRTMKLYHFLSEQIDKEKDARELKKLEQKKKELTDTLENLRNTHHVTFDFARKYGEQIRKTTFGLPDAVTVWSACEMSWNSMETILFKGAENPYFYKRNDLITFQGKQAERCIILKHNEKKNNFYIHFHDMQFPLMIKKDDVFIQETLSSIAYYMKHGEEIDKQNVERHPLGLPLLSTSRIRNNRIVRKNIREKVRYFVQIVLEGIPVAKRKKDGSFRHTYGVGRVAGDIGTQSLAVVSKDKVFLKNLAERSDHTFVYERKLYLLQRYLERSRRAMNPQYFDEKGRITKGKKVWDFSKRYLKSQKELRDLHRKAAESRKYAHNEEVNRLRSMGDEFIIEQMSIKALQKKAKEVTVNEKTGTFNRRKRFGKSIGKRSPGYFIQQAKYRFIVTDGTVKEANTWTFKASQYDHILDDTSKKQLSKRWHTLPNGIQLQRDLYSAFLLFCTEHDLQKPNKQICDSFFHEFLILHNQCIEEIKNKCKVVLNSGITCNKGKIVVTSA
ncbi:hypothetical protein [Ectobacillus funiculus]|uniref:hypothetical protein n=1 Tax=Ectobacillus funiculus TaxID=137993 RepID=UPI00101E0246|nr:hypothetical protein [Ectobacillus funiculus]